MNNDTNNTNDLNGSVLGAVNPNPTPDVNGVPQPPEGGINTGVQNTTLNNDNTPNPNEANPNAFTIMINNPTPTIDNNANPTVNPVPQSTPVSPVDNVNPTPQNSTPTIQPEPAYTNPQTIDNNVPPVNNAPLGVTNIPGTVGQMPGFDSSSVIGTNPPISLDGDNNNKKQKKKGSKITFIILIVGVLALLGFGVYWILNNTDIMKNNKNNFETKNFQINLGATLPEEMSVYVTTNGFEANNCSKDTSGVNTEAVGEYEFTITCSEKTKKGTITVVDNRVLEVVPKVVYKVVGDAATANEFVYSANIESTYEFEDQNAVTTVLSTPGVYDVKIKATSSNEQTTTVDAKLIVLQYAIKRYYTCDIATKDVATPKATDKSSYRFIVSENEGQNIYGGLTEEIHEFKLSTKEDYDKLKEDFNTNKSLTINDIKVDGIGVRFDDVNMTITYTNEIDNNTLIAAHGAETFTTYPALKNYFETTLGYTCKLSETP